MMSIFHILRPLILCCPLVVAGVLPGFAANSDTTNSAGGAAGAALATPDLITASQMGGAGLIDSLGGPYAPLLVNPRPFIAEFAPATNAEPEAVQPADGSITERWSNGWVSPADRPDASALPAPR